MKFIIRLPFVPILAHSLTHIFKAYVCHVSEFCVSTFGCHLAQFTFSNAEWHKSFCDNFFLDLKIFTFAFFLVLLMALFNLKALGK